MPKGEAPSLREKYASELAEIAQIAGVANEREVFLYSSHPTLTQRRWVFSSWVGGVPGVKEVCLSRDEAAENVATLLAWCRAHPDRARALTEEYRQ